MANYHEFKTTITLLRPNGDEHEVNLEVGYRVYRGCAETHVQPGEDDGLTITYIAKVGEPFSATFLGDLLYDDEELLAECGLHWADTEADAAEYRAEQRRDDAMMERLS